MSEQYATGLADEIAAKVAARLGAVDRPLLTVQQLADRLAVSYRKARLLIEGDPRRGVPPAIPSILVGEGSRRIEAAEVDRYVRSRQDSD